MFLNNAMKNFKQYNFHFNVFKKSNYKKGKCFSIIRQNPLPPVMKAGTFTSGW